MDPSEAYEFINSRRRRDEKKRHHVETAVEGLISRYGLLPETAHALNEGIYGLYRNVVAQKILDDQDRQYRQMIRRAERELAVRTATASGTESSAYLADAREFAAHMIRLETLERRNLGRNASIVQASTTTWVDLSPQERRKARPYLAGNVLPGNKTRQPAPEVTFLTAVAGLIEQATGVPISFSSTSDTRRPSSGRHHGVKFDVMMAAAAMANCRLSNEAMARRIQRIRRQNPQVSR
jgi:hypothetical protein